MVDDGEDAPGDGWPPKNFKLFYTTVGKKDSKDIQVFHQVAFYRNATTKDYNVFPQNNLFKSDGRSLSDAGNIHFTSQGTNLIFTDMKTKEMKTFLSTAYNQKYQEAQTLDALDEEVQDDRRIL